MNYKLPLRKYSFFLRIDRVIKKLCYALIILHIILFINIAFIKFELVSYNIYFSYYLIFLSVVFITAFLYPVNIKNLSKIIDHRLKLKELIQTCVELTGTDHVFYKIIYKYAKQNLIKYKATEVFKFSSFKYLIILIIMFCTSYYYVRNVKHQKKNIKIAQDSEIKKKFISEQGQQLEKIIKPNMTDKKELVELMDKFKLTAIDMKKNKLNSYETIKRLSENNLNFKKETESIKKSLEKNKSLINKLAQEFIKNKLTSQIGQNILIKKFNTAANDSRKLAQQFSENKISKQQMKNFANTVSSVLKQTSNVTNSELKNLLKSLHKNLTAGNTKSSANNITKISKLISKYGSQIRNYNISKNMQLQSSIAKHKIAYADKLDKMPAGQLAQNFKKFVAQSDMENLPDNFSLDNEQLEKMFDSAKNFKSNKSGQQFKGARKPGSVSAVQCNAKGQCTGNNGNKVSSGIGNSSTNKKSKYFKITGQPLSTNKISDNVSDRIENYKKLYKESFLNVKGIKKKTNSTVDLENLKKNGKVMLYKTANDGSESKLDFYRVLNSNINVSEKALDNNQIPAEYTDKIQKYYESFVK